MSFQKLRIYYNVAKNAYHLSGDLPASHQIGVLEAYIENNDKRQDQSKPHKKKCYTITLLYNPDNNPIVARHDTGNHHLKQGILRVVLRQLIDKRSLEYKASDLDF